MEALPLKLSNAIDRELAPLPPEKLREACFELTQRYAKGEFIQTQLHRHAYIAARLPATYGAVRHVLRRIESLLAPLKTFLDLGAGVGSNAWAAADAMPDLERVTLIEKDVELLHLGQHLTQNNLDPIQLAWCRTDITHEPLFPIHDVVLLSYVLNELSLKEQSSVLQRAYEATDKLLILVEPGTPEGFNRLLAARQFLTERGAYCVAPCSHDAPCPLTTPFKEGKDWCHFSVRLPRGKYHRRAKEGTLPYEDEKYAYLVVSSQPLSPSKARIIKAPIKKTGHVILDLCTPKGEVKRHIVAKSDGTSYTHARNKEWGDTE